MPVKTRLEVATGKLLEIVDGAGGFVLFPNQPGYVWIDGAHNGKTHRGQLVEGEWTVVPIPPPTPEEQAAKEEEEKLQKRLQLELTFAQLLIGLVAEGWISEAEGEAWLMDNQLPMQVLAVIEQLPASQQFGAKARALRPSIIPRLDPLVEALAQFENKTPEELDEFFETYSKV